MPIIEGTLEEVKKKGENYSWIIQKWNNFAKWQKEWRKEMDKQIKEKKKDDWRYNLEKENGK